jgi:hypothetical protein
MKLLRSIRELVAAWWNSPPPPAEWSYSSQAGEVVGLCVFVVCATALLCCVAWFFITCCFLP